MTRPALERAAIALFEQLLEVSEDERDEWIVQHTADNIPLRERLILLREGDRKAQLATGGAVDDLVPDAMPERIGAYRIVDLIGRGGMGSVYRGVRETGDFHHEAAIKVIKPGLLTDVLTERFRLERQTLANLSHPNIAQLFDGGETADGAPYIVMELVDGLPLKQWVESRPFDQGERLHLFNTVCRAVGFAHRNLVVHRDLTPSNILVNRDGVVKLIDFGIAKAPDPEQPDPEPGAVSIGNLSLTPGYAAPERMASNTVTTAADIYSLGKLLAWLLPVSDPELQAIIGRACADDPNARYPTADALAEDLEAWEHGMPVAAAARGRGYIVGKFVRRHRLSLGAAGVGLTLLVVALGIALYANHRAQIARQDAEHRFAETRAIAKAMLFDVYDDVSRAPGSTQARASLARTAMSYLDTLAADPDAPLDVKLEAALGYVRLAQVTGGGQSGQLGLTRDSDALLARAESILAPLQADHGTEPGYRKARATLLLEQAGSNLYSNNAIDLARRQATEAQVLVEPLATTDAEAAANYALALQTQGDSYGWDNDYARARPYFRRAEAFIAALPRTIGDSRRVLMVRSGNLRLLAEASHELEAEDEAVGAIDRAVAINRGLVSRSGEDPALVRKLAGSLWYRAVMLRVLGREPEARTSIGEAVDLARSLMVRDPSDAGAAQLFAITGEVGAQVLADAGDRPGSRALSDEMIAAHRRVVALSGNAAGTRRSMAMALRTRGGNFYNLQDFPRACEAWREAIAILDALDREGALTDIDRENGVPEMRGLLAHSCDGGPPRQGSGPLL